VTEHPDVSISIVNLNTSEMLDKCLVRIETSCVDLSHEIIVVDNGSSDDSCEMVAQRHPNVNLIRNESNRYFSAAHNQAFSRARGDYVLILNSDILVQVGCISNLLQFMDAHREIGAAGCLLLDHAGNPTRSAWRDPTLISTLLGHWLATKLVRRSRSRDEYNMVDWDGLTTREVEVAMDALLCVRREALDAVDGYDEAMLLYYTEQDLCLRLRRAGWLVFFFAGSSAVHVHQYTSRAMNPWWIWWVRRRDMVAYFRKHHGWLKSQLLNAVWTVDIVLRVPLQGLIKRAKSWTGAPVQIRASETKDS
jgi:GT2 family glycosyltransferase